jgi:hypothetical protein
VGVGFSLAYERSLVDFFQTSISAYYYTPVQSWFVGALIGVGLCLFALKGNTQAEDTLLDLAGMFAPIVALVPTPEPGHCASVLGTTQDRNVNIANNVRALLALELLALLLAVYLNRARRPPRSEIVDYVLGSVVWLTTLLTFSFARHCFVRNAHFVAAGAMFACIIAVVWINALSYKEQTEATSVANRYAAIAAAMLASLVVIPVGLFGDWPYWVIVLEGLLISLFALFWGIQTHELWHKGIR